MPEYVSKLMPWGVVVLAMTVVFASGSLANQVDGNTEKVHANTAAIAEVKISTTRTEEQTRAMAESLREIKNDMKQVLEEIRKQP